MYDLMAFFFAIRSGACVVFLKYVKDPSLGAIKKSLSLSLFLLFSFFSFISFVSCGCVPETCAGPGDEIDKATFLLTSHAHYSHRNETGEKITVSLRG